jgi:pimeloyl-ACP methyl ester carboxylesterase
VRYVLVPGAGGAAWYWHRVVPLLEAAGHEAVAVDLPGDDETAGLRQYADRVLSRARAHDEVVLVGQSLGGFTVPMAARDLTDEGSRPRAIVLVNAMIPVPGETPGAWWENVGQQKARIEAALAGGWPVDFDLDSHFLHDVDAAVAAAGERHQRVEAAAVFESVCDIAAWPDVPTRVISAVDDRFFPLTFQQRIARERLGLEPRVVPGGHLVALSQLRALADGLLDLPS